MRPDRRLLSRFLGKTLAVLFLLGTFTLTGSGAASAVDYGSTGDGGGGQGGLAWTGASAILPLSVLGGSLVVLGGCLVVLMRRRLHDRR